MLAFVKTLLYLGAILLVGSGAFIHFIYLKPLAKRRLLIGAVLGAFLLLLASDLDIVLTLNRVLGFMDLEILLEYLSSTRHGNAILLRIQLIVLLLGIIILACQMNNAWSRFFTGIIYLPTSLALLATFSWTSHATAMGGTTPMIADLVHFSAAAFWGGSLFYFAYLPIWKNRTPALVQASKNLSFLGIASVAALFATGIYAGALHINSTEVLIDTFYGRVLILKIMFVFIIIAVAGVNRFYLLPRLINKDNALLLGDFARVEVALLIGVFVATGILTTSPLPHE